MAIKVPLKLAICSWCYGVGGGASRMETYYYQLYDRKLFDPHFISLIDRPLHSSAYDNSIPFIQIDQKNRFFDLVDKLKDFDIIQFQGSFDPIVCEASKYLPKSHVLLEVLHNIETGGLIDSVDGTICVSNAVAKVQKPNSKHRTILNGINIADFPFSEKEIIGNKIILLQVGRREKVAINLDEISDQVLSIDPRIEIWIAGGEQNLNSTDRVKFLGVRENIADLYKQAHYMILLSKEEPFGLVALESMASGTPVILSKSGGFLDIIENPSHGYLVEGPSKERAIEVIKEAVSIIDSPRYSELALAGRKLVENKFSIEHCIKQYENYIIELYNSKEQTNGSLEPLSTPPNALVGEALYDFQAGDFNALSSHLTDLSLSPFPITEVHTLKMAHDLGRFLKNHNPNLVPKGLFPYLFFSGDRTEFTCDEILSDIEFLKQRELFKDVYQYFEETKDKHLGRWERIKKGGTCPPSL